MSALYVLDVDVMSELLQYSGIPTLKKPLCISGRLRIDIGEEPTQRELDRGGEGCKVIVDAGSLSFAAH